MKHNYVNYIKCKLNSRQSSAWFRTSSTSKTSSSYSPIRLPATSQSNRSRLHDHKLRRALDTNIAIKELVSIATVLKGPIVGMLLLPIVLATSAQAATVERTGQRVLMIEMTPALCSMQPSRARMRQCLEGYSFTVSGLNIGYSQNCGRASNPRLTPLQLKVVNRIVPDTTVRSQIWQRYGACSPLSANSYFRQIVNYASQLKLPDELSTGNSYTVSKSSFIRQMTRLNSGMSSSSIDLVCQAGSRRQSILTEVHVCYEGSSFGSCSNVIDSCDRRFIISGRK